MSVFLKSLRTKPLFQIHKILTTPQCQASGHWFPDYIPGPYPETEEERRAAAKKYNLLPEEYKPYPNDENGNGDYPQLPYVSVDAKDPYYPWDMPDVRRDFNEPLHERFMDLLPEFVSTSDKVSVEGKKTLAYVGVTLILGYLVYLIQRFQIVHPCSERQYPAPGVVHYTFEIKNEGFPPKASNACADEETNDVETKEEK